MNGRFTGPQADVYDLVLDAQSAAVAAIRPGASFIEPHDAAVKVLAQGMIDFKLLHGSLDAVIETGSYRRFYMHRTSHWLGRDVHDVGEYLSLDEEPVDQLDGYGARVVKKPSRALQPGMVITIEPGIYVRPAESVPERFWHIGIRIEDDAVVTPAGCELISRGVPVDPREIERLMRA